MLPEVDRLDERNKGFMKNIIIGTAGHVDHGKTALIKALTGIETDRIKEEKKRGITIELGFAYLDLPDGEKAGIIDVPGHEKFVKNMLAGAGGIDLALLVVAADEGFMPQTREHLGILSLLDIPEGIIVITKKDIVDEDWLEMMKEDIRAQVAGTFLENAPMIAVSSYTGEGIEELRQKIFALIDQNTQLKNLQKPWRIPADRVFSIEGFGTVITGTLIEGTVKVGDPVTVYPSGISTKVRNLQVHSKDVDTAYAGQRVAMNLAGLKKSDLAKGDVAAQPGSMINTMMVDVRMSILKDCERQILNNTRLHLYHGARDILCKLVLLDRDAAQAGDVCYAQLRLEEEVALKTGDHFVLRFYSPLETIGGGVVLDSNPFKHKRNDPVVLEDLKVKDTGSEKERIAVALREYSSKFESLDVLQVQTNIDREVFDKQIEKLLKDKTAYRISDSIVIHSDYITTLKESATRMLEAYHKETPLREGMKKEEFRGKLVRCDDIAIVDKLIDSLVNRKVLKIVNGCVALADFEVQANDNQQELMGKIEAVLKNAGIAVPSVAEVQQMFPKEKNFKQVLEALINTGRLVRVEDKICLHWDVYADCYEKSRQYIQEHGQMTLAEFRDMMGTSRKYAMAILEYWDRRGITKKVGDARVLGTKGIDAK